MLGPPAFGGATIGTALITPALVPPKLGQGYVVTNMRAMTAKGGKVVEEAPLDTPNSVVPVVDESTHATVTPFSRTASITTVVGTFVANGAKLLRFGKLKSGRASGLLSKLSSTGITTEYPLLATSPSASPRAPGLTQGERFCFILFYLLILLLEIKIYLGKKIN
ncbi:MAG: hypothetical protein ACP5HQ_03060 [Thermoprotei archaeon]